METTPVSAAYDRWAPTYDECRNVTRDLDAQILRTFPLLCIEGRDVLELGCGTGKNTVWLAEQARSVIAVDFSARMLGHARSRMLAGRVDFVEHDVEEQWPFADACVDVVVADLILEHVRQLGPIFAQAARVLRRGGQLFLSELHPYRQLIGRQAEFVDPEHHETVRVPAYAHSIAEYVNGGIAAGFTLAHLGEWLESGSSTPGSAPRLLSALFCLA